MQLMSLFSRKIPEESQSESTFLGRLIEDEDVVIRYVHLLILLIGIVHLENWCRAEVSIAY